MKDPGVPETGHWRTRKELAPTQLEQTQAECERLRERAEQSEAELRKIGLARQEYERAMAECERLRAEVAACRSRLRSAEGSLLALGKANDE